MFYSRQHDLHKYDLDSHTLQIVATSVRVNWWARSVKLPAFDDRKSLDHYAALAAWQVEAGSVSPLSDRFALNLCHLRPIRGGSPVVKLFPAATHEFAFGMCDPDLGGWDKGAHQLLRPLSYVVQLALRFDHAAVWVGDCIARAFVDGRFPFEPGGIRGATKLFVDNCKEWQAQAARIFDARN